jgi:hypothetical protein
MDEEGRPNVRRALSETPGRRSPGDDRAAVGPAHVAGIAAEDIGRYEKSGALHLPPADASA